jgi:hypothetical protein
VVPDAVHWLEAQQGWPRPPQVPQLPAVQTWELMEQVVPWLMHL